MGTYNYSKHKDNSPEDTIYKIQGILNKAGLFTVLNWKDNDFITAVSNRVTLYPTELGTNGKGTDKLYAAASAYAELLERLQNGFIWTVPEYSHADVSKEVGFATAPDEKLMPISEVLNQETSFFNVLFERLGLTDKIAQEILVSRTLEAFNCSHDDMVNVVPFVNPVDNRIEWLPYRFVLMFYGSNGMSSGNTIEEAMVQGLSEIFERYVNFKIVNGEVVPPAIPREYLKQFSVYDIIKDFERSDAYTVEIFDCTLGRGLPVAAAVITNKAQGTMSIKFGSHPSFAVAVERTLTEAVQSGTKLNILTSFCHFGNEQRTKYIHNAVNIMKVGCGYYPYKFRIGKPDWEFKPWDYTEKASNKELLTHMFEILQREGFKPIIRDNSHLGFPACFILVPGMSEMYTDVPMHFKGFNTALKFIKAFNKFPYLTEQEEDRLLKFIIFKENSIIENELSFAMLRPFKGKRMTMDRLAAFLALKHGNYKLSRHFFEKLYVTETDEDEKSYLQVMIEYVKSLDDGLTSEEAHELISKLYMKKFAERVINETHDHKTIMERNFPHLNCFDCEHCEISGTECTHLIERELYSKLMHAMKNSTVSNESFLKLLVDIMPSK